MVVYDCNLECESLGQENYNLKVIFDYGVILSLFLVIKGNFILK